MAFVCSAYVLDDDATIAYFHAVEFILYSFL